MFALAFRPVTVVVAHVLMLVLVILMLPVWLLCAFRGPDQALTYIREFRGWSRDVVAAARTAGRTIR